MITPAQCSQAFGGPKSSQVLKFLVLWVVPDEFSNHVLPKKIYCHKLMVEPLTRAFRELFKTGCIAELNTWDGCYVVRVQRGATTFSLHSWGLAIDVNAATNSLGSKSTLTDEFVNCFKSNGFDWGGDFLKRKDPMHFQLRSIL